jgi:hypothetical protein
MSTIRLRIRDLGRLGAHIQRLLVRVGARVLRGLSRYHATVGRPRILGLRGLPELAPDRHEGATERFGAELRAMRHMEVSPELISEIETELQWGLIWHGFERAMQAEIDKAFAPYFDAMTECTDFDDLRNLVGLVDPVLT